MSTLTETVVEIADQHTTLFYLGKEAANNPLPFTTSADYVQLHQNIFDAGTLDLSDLRQGYQGQILKRLSLSYDNYRYWRLSLRSEQPHLYPDSAWEAMLPIHATVLPKISIIKDQAFTFRVLPIPRVVLYPFGWSTWLSLRIVGAHTLSQLAQLLKALFTTAAFQFATEEPPISLDEVMRRIADGVRIDAFGGDKNTGDVVAAERTLVTTVLAKHDGSPSVAAIGDDEAPMRVILQPASGVSPRTRFEELVYQFEPNNPLKFMLWTKHARFIWMEDKLNADGRNRQHLHCYHNNTFRLAVHARHLLSALNEAVRQRVKTVPLIELVRVVVDFLEQPNFRNASLVAFLEEPGISKSLERAEKWLKNQK